MLTLSLNVLTFSKQFIEGRRLEKMYWFEKWPFYHVIGLDQFFVCFLESCGSIARQQHLDLETGRKWSERAATLGLEVTDVTQLPTFFVWQRDVPLGLLPNCIS